MGFETGPPFTAADTDSGLQLARKKHVRFAWMRIFGTTASLVFLIFVLFVLFADGMPGGSFGYFWVAFYIAIACFNYAMSIRQRLKAGRSLRDELPLIAGLVAIVVATSVTAVIRLVE